MYSLLILNLGWGGHKGADRMMKERNRKQQLNQQ